MLFRSGNAFVPQVLAGFPDNAVPLFQIPWIREQASDEQKPVEYRQIGGTGGELVKEAREMAALEEWLRQGGKSPLGDQTRA